MTEAFPKNFIDYEEYPMSADIQNRCVSMIARLFNAPTSTKDATAIGTSTVGSSEAIMLGVLAMKRRWQTKMKAAGKPTDKPNIIMNSAVQVCWEKAARYFEVEERYVYCTPDRYVIDPQEAVNLIDENTVSRFQESSLWNSIFQWFLSNVMSDQADISRLVSVSF
jgi:glutamate decarboxylase